MESVSLKATVRDVLGDKDEWRGPVGDLWDAMRERIGASRLPAHFPARPRHAGQAVIRALQGSDLAVRLLGPPSSRVIHIKRMPVTASRNESSEQQGDVSMYEVGASNNGSTPPEFASRDGIVQWLKSQMLAETWHGIPITWTPLAAQAVLTFLNPSNREYREARARKYAAAYAKGRWRKTSSGVGLDAGFNLTNGQHRLGGIVISGVAVDLMTVFHCDKDARAVEDDHIPCNEADRLSKTGTEATKLELAILKMFLTAPATAGRPASWGSSWDIEDLRSDLEAYRANIHFAMGLPGAMARDSGLKHAVILAALARASRFESHEKLQEFATVFATRVGESSEQQSAAKFASYLDRHDHLRKGGRDGRAQLYKMCQSAIKAFCEGRVLGQIRGTDADLWPLPKKP